MFSENCHMCDKEETERINLNMKYKAEGLDATSFDGGQKPHGLGLWLSDRMLTHNLQDPGFHLSTTKKCVVHSMFAYLMKSYHTVKATTKLLLKRILTL